MYNVPQISVSTGAEITGFEGKSGGIRNLNLTSENLLGIFNGSIRYWNDSQLVSNNKALQDVNESIIVTVRRDWSGTTSIFTRALAAFSANWPVPFALFSDGK